MRPILFRGKTIDDSTWAYGYYVFLPRRRGICGQIITERDSDRHYVIRVGGGSIEVNPTTVGQYTGLTDKNGKKIFEGDIVEDNSGDNLLLCYDSSIRRKRRHRAVVKFGRHYVPSGDPWEWGAAYGYFLDPEGDVFSPQISEYRDEGNGFALEVIGNIHDNPELLEVGQK